MSIYDDLANSDFIDKGKFKAQLREHGFDPEQPSGEDEDDILDDYGQHEIEKPTERADGNMDTMGLQNLTLQGHNPMDNINEASIRNNDFKPIQPQKQPELNVKSNLYSRKDIEIEVQAHQKSSNLNFDQQINQASHKKEKFEQQTRNRESLLDGNLLEYPDEKQHLPFGEIDRKKFIMDNDSEEGEDPFKTGSLPKNAQLQSHLNQKPDYRQENDHFTLNQYESKQEIQRNINQDMHDQLQTAHFTKQGSQASNAREQEVPEGKITPPYPRHRPEDTMAFNIESQKRILSQGTGQFGSKERVVDNEEHNSAVDQFNSNAEVSPRIRNKQQEKNEKIDDLLAQLQAPMESQQDPLAKLPSNFDIEKAHNQMQESIKQLKLINDPSHHAEQDSNRDGMGFNGQNSLYELAKKVGHPLSSSNLNSTSNIDEKDFQKFLQGEGSLGLGNSQFNPYMQYGVQSHSTQPEELAAHNYANDQAHHLLVQMQDSNLSQKQAPAQKKSLSRERVNVFQNAGQQIFQNEKENINARNIAPIMQTNMNFQEMPSVYSQNQIVTLNNQASQYQQNPAAAKRVMSLAERAHLSKQNQNYNAPPQIPKIYQQQMPQYAQQIQMPYDQMSGRISDPYSAQSRPSDPYKQMYGQAQNPSYVQPPFDPIQPRAQEFHQPVNQMPYHGQTQDFSQTNQHQKLQKRQTLMSQFDDIPIHQLHKAEGYYVRNIDDSEIKENNRQIKNQDDEEELLKLSLKDMSVHNKWTVRQKAYNEINKLFNNYNYDQETTKEDEMYGNAENPFDVYGPIIENMIKDTNLTSQYEGLTCLLSYARLGKDIKSVTFACHSYLLDKIQHNKPNLKDITSRILQVMLSRKEHIIPEIVKRFSSKNKAVIGFCLDIMIKAIQDGNLSMADINLKMLYQQTSLILNHPNKEVRDSAFQLMVFIYQNCEDNKETFVSHLKNLRPVQVKEIQDQLQATQKNNGSEFLVKLFDKAGPVGVKEVQPEKSPQGRSKSYDSGKAKDLHQIDEAGDEFSQIDILNLIPENWSEIPYLSQINIKKKSMEQFNQELENLVKKQKDEPVNVVRIKDYSAIFNVIVHMLEDPNTLVFIEAIKMVEHLCYLLKGSIKQKMKQFISLLADKYKETKTAVLNELEKTFDTIIENKCIPATSFFDQMINTIALSHKNPRVKQMVIDRVELLIEKFYITGDGKMKNQAVLGQVYEKVKDKLKQIILKDTNAQVRDSGVSLLTTFRIILAFTEDENHVQQLVNSLPKARISEINFRVEHYFEHNVEAKGQAIPEVKEEQYSSRISVKSREKSAGKRGAKSNRQKSNEKFAPPRGEPEAQENKDLLFLTKKAQQKVSSQFQMSLSDVILTIKNLGSSRDRLRPEQIESNFLQSLEEFAEEGVIECKPAIIKCIHWLLTTQTNDVDFIYDSDRQQGILSILMLIKKMYCIKRSFEDKNELFDAIRCIVRCFGLCENQNAVNQVFNVLQIAALNCKVVSCLQLVKMVNQCMMTKGPETGLKEREQISREIGGTIQYISDKLSDLMLFSQMNDSLNDNLTMNDFEDLRTAAIGQIEQMGDDEENKDIIIDSLVYLKQKMKIYQEKNMEEMKESPTGFMGTEKNDLLPENREYEENRESQQSVMESERPIISRDEEVMQMIDENFEQGLLALKELVKEVQSGQISFNFDIKQKIIEKLLSLTTAGYHNPSEQYKQAYSLKALMWLKEEFIGLEETFKLSHLVMDGFSRAMLEERDSSIEQYLLNFWCKDLSLRDITDRIQACSKSSIDAQQDVFNILFSWVVSQRIIGQDENVDKQQWNLEDFRKVSIMLAENIITSSNLRLENQEMSTKFIDLAVTKFSAKKVRDFMEIQLIHENDVLIRFLDIFDGKYASLLTEVTSRNASLLHEPLLTERTGQTTSGLANDRSSMLRELRNKRKENQVSQKGEDDPESTLEQEKKKYEEIMSRLDQFKSKTNAEGSENISVAIQGVKAEMQRIGTQARGEGEFERPASKRYSTQQTRENALGAPKSHHQLSKGDMTNSLDEDDFKLSEQHQSIAGQVTHMLNNNSSNNMSSVNPQNHEGMRNLHNSSGQGVPTHHNSVKTLGEGLRDPNVNQMQRSIDYSQNNSVLQESRQKIRESVQNQEERLQHLETSQIKVRQIKNEVDQLEDERKKLQMEKEMMLQEKNQQSEQWKERYKEMTLKNDEIVANLAHANQHYLKQVGENDKLHIQIEELQSQHREMIQKFRDIEIKLHQSEKQVEEQKLQLEESMGRTDPRKDLIVEEQFLSKVEEVFDQNQMMAYGQNEGEDGVRKIQELLLDTDCNPKALSKSMIVHYQKMRGKVDRMKMINALKVALEHEDVLYAISVEIYRSLLNFLLNAFSFEKELIERESIAQTHEREQQNELTQESQKLVSKLLNSKEFTASLIVLLQLLKNEAMPDDITANLSIQERHYMRVIMRCISRITKALHSESTDLIRSFDVLHEMHSLFKKHPPENLRQDLPCLTDFDFIYRGLKDVSDKLIELQPNKCRTFLEFAMSSSDSGSTHDSATGAPPCNNSSTFTKYLSQMLQAHSV